MAGFLSSKAGKFLLNAVYCVGAAVVIVGAWAKITHLSWANEALTIGLLTEAAIFLISVLVPPGQDYDWALVYPELAGMVGAKKAPLKSGPSATQQLDKALEDAKIGPELFQSLSSGMKQLGDSATKLAKVSDVNGVTDDYVVSLKGATNSFKELSVNYQKASSALTGIASDPNTANYGEALQNAAKKLQALNTVYEQQIKSASDFGQNLTKLNQVYGNILGAMTIK